jgi:cytidine deaminase
VKTAASSGPEVFFGLVGAIGTDLLGVANMLGDSLKRFNYNCMRLHLIDDLQGLQLTVNGKKPKWAYPPSEPYEARAKALMNLGNEFCKELQYADAVARLAIMSVQYARERISGDSQQPVPRQAYILSSLKRPDEVVRLRQMYGRAFFLISVYSDHQRRLEALAGKIAKSRGKAQADRYMDKAQALVVRDEQDAERFGAFGQNIQDTFHRADVFVNADNVQALRSQIDRFISLVFGDPHHTPLQDEFGMYLAQAAGLRSGDPSRQVGASLVNSMLDVLGLGTNDAPKAGGDIYWPNDAFDARDLVLGTDSNADAKVDIVKELMARLCDERWLATHHTKAVRKDLQLTTQRALTMLKGTQLLDLTEFGRALHAEMTALVGAARRGVPVQGATLYVTLFPCHNCAKHLIAAGVKRVVYIEPYPKSRAVKLHGDAIAMDGHVPKGEHVLFEPFVGVAPRRYADLFGFEPKERKTLLRPGGWAAASAEPKFTKAGGYYRNMHVMWEFMEAYALNKQMSDKKLKADQNRKRNILIHPRSGKEKTA